MVGIEFTLLDGTTDSYDPINMDNDFQERVASYVFNNGIHTYEIDKSTVKSMREYELCVGCKREVFQNGCGHFDCEHLH